MHLLRAPLRDVEAERGRLSSRERPPSLLVTVAVSDPAGDDASATRKPPSPARAAGYFVKCRGSRWVIPVGLHCLVRTQPARVGAALRTRARQNCVCLGRWNSLARPGFEKERRIRDGWSVQRQQSPYELPPSAARHRRQPIQSLTRLFSRPTRRQHPSRPRWAGYPAITEYLDDRHRARQDRTRKAPTRALRSLDGSLAVKTRRRNSDLTGTGPVGRARPLPASTPPARAGAVADIPFEQPNGECPLAGVGKKSMA